MRQNIYLQSNDKIFIAKEDEAKIIVFGEVNNPGLINLPKGYMSIKEAIAKSSGIAFTGDQAHILVIRTSAKDPKIYELSFKDLLNLPTRALLLMDEDILYVSAKPITDWNRFINQVLPTIAMYDTAFNRLKNLGIFIDAK